MSKHWFIVAAALAVAIAVYLGTSCTRAPVSTTRLAVHFIDVAQGDSILIATAKGRTILVDGGDVSEGKTVCDYLADQQIGHLDAIILTHPHADHVGGLLEVLDRFPVDRVYDAAEKRGPKIYRAFLDAVKEKGVRYVAVNARTSLTLDNDTSLEFLGPSGPLFAGTENDTDNNSLALRVTCGEVTFLLLGDLQREGAGRLLESKIPLKAQVLKVPHHGSVFGVNDELLRAVSPHWAVISVGEGNGYEYPHPETIRRLLESGIRVLRTDLNGSIVLSTDGTHIRENVEKAL